MGHTQKIEIHKNHYQPTRKNIEVIFSKEYQLFNERLVKKVDTPNEYKHCSGRNRFF